MNYEFFLTVNFLRVISSRLKFLRSAICNHGECKWHIIIDSVAYRFGILDDESTGRTGAARLGQELRYVVHLLNIPSMTIFDSF